MKYGFVKVAAAVPTVKVADVDYNVQQIESLLAQAEGKGVEVMVTPELCLTGYSCQDLFREQLLLDKAEMKTVPIMIAQLRSADYSKFDMGKVYMFILLAILPVLIVYLILSRFIIKGVTAGAVKG